MKILVVGCERSGTSAISHLISIGSGLRLLDDPPESWYTYPLMYMSGNKVSLKLWLKMRFHEIVKVPGFAVVLPSLDRSFLGKFKVVYCVRDPRDVLASIKERLRQSYSPLLTDVNWLNISVNSLEEAVAWRWRKYLEAAMEFNNSKQGKDKVIFIRYEDFNTDKVKNLNFLANSLNIEISSEKLAPFLDKQFKKVWSNKIRGESRWQEDITGSEATLVFDICKQQMNRWGYS